MALGKMGMEPREVYPFAVCCVSICMEQKVIYGDNGGSDGHISMCMAGMEVPRTKNSSETGLVRAK